MTHGVGICLLGVVAGYWVLERAETHKTSLRPIGRLLGWLIILASLAGAICSVSCPSGMGHFGKGGMCPMMPKMGSPASVPTQ